MSTETKSTKAQAQSPSVETTERVIIRFAGDSGDGIQLMGNQYTSATAVEGNDLATLPDFPAEIRAPAGTLPGVSGFQISFSSFDIHTPGDQPDVLVAMNPAALKTNLKDLPEGGMLVVNTDAFEKTNLRKAGYEANPLEDGTLSAYRVFAVPITELTRSALKDLDLNVKVKDRCKNFFALGMMFYLYQRRTDVTMRWIERKFKKSPDLVEANATALKAGYAYCEAAEIFPHVYQVEAAPFPQGDYRNIMGNSALALGLVAASQKAGMNLFLGSYPITPASTILHELSHYKEFGVVTFQAEDEIAAVCSAIGASFAGALGATSTSGPGLALKGEALGLAVMTELPLVILNIQRGGPSTGLPTKTEQADLLQAMFGRNGEAPMPVLSASTPADCFQVAFEAARIAVRYMTPVLVLSDGYLANGAEPWRIPQVDELPTITPEIVREAPEGGFHPYRRNEQTLARNWALPGTPGLEHRLGGLEKEDVSGNVSYDPQNHERMVRLRAEKVERVAQEFPPTEIDGEDSGRLLIVGWGSTQGAIKGAVRRLRSEGVTLSHIHLRYLNPLPRDLGEILRRFEKVLVPEMNMGQLAFLMRGRYLVDAISYSKVQGQPFRSSEIMARVRQLLG
ncbi:MAG: 2-oxoacid:acceptor oxidoreductase subunit alpha [Acidobacteriota bacterium]|jgi:2-oxoglutarate ferredoxin oxidoreductase subunit alpha